MLFAVKRDLVIFFCKMTVPDEELLPTPPPSADFTAGFMTGHRGCSAVDHLAK